MEIDNVLKRQLRTESYDQKLEHRAAKHECLRDRNNVTSCRSPGTPQESEWKSIMRRKRQREFQKRRKISSEAALAAGGKEATQKEKVTLRGNRRKMPLIHRQSLVSSQDLGIIWPDINAFAEASQMSSTSSKSEHDTVRSSCSPDITSSTGSFLDGEILLRRGVKTFEGVPNNKRSKAVSVSDFSCQTECGYVTMKEEDLIQLGEYLKEALWREESLKQKLALLQQETSTLLTYCDKMWRVCFKEDLMKCKIGALESQLQVFSQVCPFCSFGSCLYRPLQHPVLSAQYIIRLRTAVFIKYSSTVHLNLATHVSNTHSVALLFDVAECRWEV